MKPGGRKIKNAVGADLANESDSITAKLTELYMMLETGQMIEAEFDAAEKVLLDRLDVLNAEESEEEDENPDTPDEDSAQQADS